MKNKKPGFPRSTVLVNSALIWFASNDNDAFWSCLCPTCFNPSAPNALKKKLIDISVHICVYIAAAGLYKSL